MEALRETALLGTEKKSLDIQRLPEPVREMLKEAHGPDSEWQFLEAGVLNYFYELAGKRPATFTGTIDEKIIEEEMAIAPKELMDIYNQIDVVDHHLQDSALSLWLDVLIEKKLIVNADRLVELIQAGKRASSQTKEKVVTVIGHKGKWILENDASHSYAVAPAGDHLWMEGSTQERRNIFLALRKNDPVAAITLLKSTWETESVVNKKGFLELIRQTLVESDVSFLEELNNTEFKFQSKEKKTEKECRRLVVAALLKFSSSTLYKTTVENLQQYLVKGKKGIVGFVTGQAGNTFRLPEEEDNFWNAKTMEEVYGFEIKNYDIAIYSSPMQFWLSFFVQFLPFHFWVNAFESDHKKAVQTWLIDRTIISGEKIAIYLNSMINNAQEQNDRTLALAIIQSVDPRTVIPLLKVMDPEDFESFILKNNYLDDIHVLMNGPFGSERSWSLSFSEKIINHGYKLAEKNQASGNLGNLIAQLAHHTSIDLLININNKAQDSVFYDKWNKSIFQVAYPLLDIRNKIHTLKK